jgi:esterase/lipase superfamily enzyme
MKNLVFIALVLNLIACTHAEKALTVDLKPAEAPVEILDLKWREELKKIWNAYFTNDYSDTNTLNVFYVTNRALRGAQAGCTDEQFGITTDPAQTRAGICRINVPRNHVTGELKFTKDLRQSSSEYFKFIGHKTSTVTDVVALLKKSRRIPLVFVHGFNVKFQDAILRSAQLAYDLKYQGPLVLFSWPAGAGDGFIDDKLINVTYRNNKKSAEESVEVIKKFFSELQKENLKINLLVHSMGHQVVLPALNEMALDNTLTENKSFLNELILNAPDFELQQFPEMAENIKKISQRVTLYCSYNDNAMVASEVFNKTTRLGACANVEGIDTINVSLIDAPALGIAGLGHGYYSSRPILSDIFQVLIGLDAKKRLFIRDSEPNSTEKFYIRP